MHTSLRTIRLVPVSAFVVTLLLGVAAAPPVATAVTCGADPVLNTQNVLCAAGNACNATLVDVTTDIDITAGGCTFDLGGRDVKFEKTFNARGDVLVTIMNVNNVTTTPAGKLKARGDFMPPAGAGIIDGGEIDVFANGTITHGGLIDVTGDSAGTIELHTQGDIVAQGGSVLLGNGSTTAVEGERFADGGSLTLESRGGSITLSGSVSFSGTNQAAGGLLDLAAARNITINQSVDASGGGGDGGDIEMDAGDDIAINNTVDASSRAGGGFGGSIMIIAGDDENGGIVPGGNVTVTSSLQLDGSDRNPIGGDGGELDISATGNIQFLGTAAVIRADGAANFGGGGGSITLDTVMDPLTVLTPEDGNIVVQADVNAQGGDGADGGVFEVHAGRDFTLAGHVSVNGKDTGGTLTAEAGGAIVVTGRIDAGGTSTAGGAGFVAMSAGNAANSGLTLSQNIFAGGGPNNITPQSVTLSGCSLTVDQSRRIEASNDTSGNSTSGGSNILLVSRTAMQLKANSTYLANPGGTITTRHPVGQNPVIGSGVTFDPPRIDEATSDGLPNCPVCGDGILQDGEVCDTALQACCNPTCSGFIAACPTVTPTPTATVTTTLTATPVQTGTRTPTPSATLTTTRTLTPLQTATRTSTPTSTPSGIASTATKTATVVNPTATPTLTPNGATPTLTSNGATSTPTATDATPTASVTATSTTSTSTPTPPVATPTATVPQSTAAPIGLPGAAGKIADKCQKAIKKAGAKFVGQKLKILDKCTGAAFKCIQTQADPAKRATCLTKAGGKCTTALGTIAAAEAQLRASFLKQCDVVLTLDQLRGDDGLGFGAIQADCASPVNVTADLAACLVQQHECEVEHLFDVQAPRAKELMRAANVPQSAIDALECLDDHGGTGLDLDDEKVTGKTVVKCAATLDKAGPAFVLAKLKSLEKCVDKVFTCVQTKPADAKCIPKAQSACDKEFLKIAGAEVKLRAAVAKSCGAIDYASVLAASDGAKLSAVATECATFGVGSLASLGEYTDCLFRQHECRVDALLPFEAPRAPSLLGMVGHTLGSAFCPTPIPTP